MHRLDGAYERLKRARTHLANLKRRVERVREEARDNVVIERKPAVFRREDGREVEGVLGHLAVKFGPLPPMLSILIGETIYNLRASLDYLVYELAALDSGQVQDGTQFPIDDSKKAFKGRGAGYLKGVSDEHIAMIKKLQPCYGCDWTRLLRVVSNPDKHRHLQPVFAPAVLKISPGSTDRIIAGEPVDVKGDLSVNVTFSDGLPVIETLEELSSQVAQTLDAFNPQFK
jgi:hypothetical protein